MLEWVHTAAIWVLMIAGSFFLLTGSLGLLRMRDFFTRAHAAGLIDTLGTLLILSALILCIGWEREIFKILLLIVLLLVTGPTTVHAMCRALRHQDNQHNETKPNR